MLSPFPTLLTLWMFAPFLLRIFLGAFLLMYGISVFRNKEKTKLIAGALGRCRCLIYLFGAVEIVAGIALIIGFLTQVASLISIVLLATALLFKIKYPHILKQSVELYIAIIVVSISLMFLGAGFFAFDLPL